MTTITKNRIASIDLLKGLVMIIMALDHVRDYFHAPAYIYDPADPIKSDLPIFFTRWITHFCAPTFSFLAGMSAYMIGRRKTREELSGFLIKRGLWLIVLELTVLGFAWYFDVQFRTLGLLVIWSLGISMIVLAALVHLPRILTLIFSLLLICCHNLFDNIHFAGSIGWSLLHEQQFFHLSDHFQLLVGYPIIPWVAVMSLGYYFGAFYNQDVTATQRKKLFNGIGFAAIFLFVILRFTNSYGDSRQYQQFGNLRQDLISFLNPSKYPPSFLYILMTLGVAFVFLANTENWRGRLVNFFCTFGRVPFFYYILHLYLIHILAVFFAIFSGFNAQKLILSTWISFEPNMKGYGFRLWVVYLVWIGIILLLYPLCKKFDKYKQAHKEKWWLSYL